MYLPHSIVLICLRIILLYIEINLNSKYVNKKYLNINCYWFSQVYILILVNTKLPLNTRNHSNVLGFKLKTHYLKPLLQNKAYQSRIIIFETFSFKVKIFLCVSICSKFGF